MSNTNSRVITGPVRAGAQTAHVYNDGLVVFVYDEANEDRIRDADPSIIWGYGDDEEENNHPGTRALLEEGAFLVYTLHQDDSVGLEVIVGEPLSADELAGGRWHAPQCARLSLPTGKLWVHSYNSLPTGDPSGDEGAVVHVPPGEYVATLYRKHWEALERDGLVTEDELLDVPAGRLVGEVLVLSPRVDAEPIGVSPSILFAPDD